VATYRHHKQHRFHTLRYGYRHWTWHQDGVRHPHHRKRRRRRRRVELPERRFLVLLGAGVGLILVLLVAQATWALFHARSDVAAAQGRLQSILNSQGALLTASGRNDAAVAINEMDLAASSANQTLNSSIGLDVLGVLPFVGTQVDGAKQLVRDLQVVAHQGTALVIYADRTANDSYGTQVNMADLATLRFHTGLTAIFLKHLVRPSDGLIGPLASARDRLNHLTTRIDHLLDQGYLGLRYAEDFLGAHGPRTYFLAGENNAEMRDQGAVLSWALLSTNAGHFDVNGAKSVGALALSSPAPVAIPPGTQAVFGSLQPTRIWQSTNATADFPTSGRFMSAMYQAATGGQVHGVLAVDVVTLQSLLRLTGPVHIPSIRGPISAGNVANVLLHRLYFADTSPSQTLRHDEIAAVAQAAIKKMNTTHVDLAALLHALTKDVEGRHLLLYDALPSNELLVRKFGGSGAIDANEPTATFHLAVQSAVAAKLDYYTQVREHVQVVIDASGSARIVTTVTVHNAAPANHAPNYQLGPDGINSSIAGQYVARVYQWSPRGSFVFGPSTPESGLVVAYQPLSVLPQHTGTLTFGTALFQAVHHHRFVLNFVPQPTLHPAIVTVQVVAPQWHLTGPATQSVVMTRDRLVSFSL